MTATNKDMGMIEEKFAFREIQLRPQTYIFREEEEEDDTEKLEQVARGEVPL